MGENQTVSASTPEGRKTTAFAVGILLAVAAAYGNGLSGELVFDDYASILNNATIRQLWSAQIFSPPLDAGVGGRPLANLSFAFNHALSGGEVWSYHLVNIALHAAAALTLFGLLRIIFPRAGPPASSATSLAGVAAIIWALHPLNTAVVDYVSQRTEALMGVFYLLTLYAFARAMNAASKLWLTLSWSACLLAMLAKEVAATAPLAVLLFDRVFFAKSFRDAWHQRRGFYVALACTWLPLLWLATSLTQRGAGFGLGLAPQDYALIESRAVLHYLRLAFWPQPLLFDYGSMMPPPLHEVFFNLATLALLIATIIVAFKHSPKAGFGAGWFFIILLPTSTIVPIALQPIAENRVYLPLAGVVALVVAGGVRLFGPRSTPLCAVLAVACGLAAFARTATYRTEERLWTDTLAKNPANPRAHHNLGTALLRANRITDAIAHFEAAIRLKPGYAEAHNGLGNALFLSGRHTEAIAQFETASQLDPKASVAHANLANVLLAAGRATEALAQCEEAIRLSPNLADLRNNRGGILRQLGRLAEAGRAYEEALQLNPAFAAAHCNLGGVLLLENQPALAVAHFGQALKLQPDYFEAQISLGVALAQLGKFSEAIRALELAVKLSPQSAPAHFNLASTLRRAGRTAEAIQQLETTLALQPDFEAARQSLDQIRSRAPATRP